MFREMRRKRQQLKEKRRAIEVLARKYSPQQPQADVDMEIEKTWKALTILEMKIEHLSGKEAIELVNRFKEN